MNITKVSDLRAPISKPAARPVLSGRRLRPAVSAEAPAQGDSVNIIVDIGGRRHKIMDASIKFTSEGGVDVWIDRPGAAMGGGFDLRYPVSAFRPAASPNTWDVDHKVVA